jgi:uncharacterized Zn ribbon protein
MKINSIKKLKIKGKSGKVCLRKTHVHEIRFVKSSKSKISCVITLRFPRELNNDILENLKSGATNKIKWC